MGGELLHLPAAQLALLLHGVADQPAMDPHQFELRQKVQIQISLITHGRRELMDFSEFSADHFAVYLGAYNLSAYEANRMTVYATDYRVEPETGYLALIQLTANITYNGENNFRF